MTHEKTFIAKVRTDQRGDRYYKALGNYYGGKCAPAAATVDATKREKAK